MDTDVKNTQGILSRLEVMQGQPVRYRLPVGDQAIDLNSLIGKRLVLDWQGVIHCTACGKKTPKSYNRGSCYPCFSSLSSNDICIVRPELCHFHKGTCREPGWGVRHCHQPHLLYLANTSGLKMGITRQENIPRRWIDQGAVQALPILRLPDRLTAGLAEVVFKAEVNDRTNWRRMLSFYVPPLDLSVYRGLLLARCLSAVQEAIDTVRSARVVAEVLENIPEVTLEYPGCGPGVMKSLALAVGKPLAGRLVGVKGQYLLFDNGVLNVSKHAGFFVSLSVNA